MERFDYIRKYLNHSTGYHLNVTSKEIDKTISYKWQLYLYSNNDKEYFSKEKICILSSDKDSYEKLCQLATFEKEQKELLELIETINDMLGNSNKIDVVGVINKALFMVLIVLLMVRVLCI